MDRCNGVRHNQFWVPSKNCASTPERRENNSHWHLWEHRLRFPVDEVSADSVLPLINNVVRSVGPRVQWTGLESESRWWRSHTSYTRCSRSECPVIGSMGLLENARCIAPFRAPWSAPLLPPEIHKTQVDPGLYRDPQRNMLEPHHHRVLAVVGFEPSVTLGMTNDHESTTMAQAVLQVGGTSQQFDGQAANSPLEYVGAKQPFPTGGVPLMSRGATGTPFAN